MKKFRSVFAGYAQKKPQLGSKVLDQRSRQHKYINEKLRQKPEFKKNKTKKRQAESTNTGAKTLHGSGDGTPG